MNMTIKLGDQVISLIGTPIGYKLAKLKMVQTWFIKNETMIKSHSHLPSVLERHTDTQERLKSYMTIIKKAALVDKQGELRDTKEYIKYLKSRIKITTPREEAWETLNKVDRQFLHEFMGEYLTKQPTENLVQFLTPVLVDHGLKFKI